VPEAGFSTGFSGAKIALLHGEGEALSILTYLRDEKPEIPYPGCWDLPGGGREGEEGPLECALRELHEEFGLHLPESQINWRRCYEALPGWQSDTWFFGGTITQAQIEAIRFGDEGQCWQMMPLNRFLALGSGVVGPLQDKLRDYLAAA
jgi:8-oxo-dGTP diphosphatase